MPHFIKFVESPTSRSKVFEEPGSLDRAVKAAKKILDEGCLVGGGVEIFDVDPRKVAADQPLYSRTRQSARTDLIVTYDPRSKTTRSRKVSA